MGNNSLADSAVPAQVLGPGGTGVLTGITAIAAGFQHALALKSDGTVWAWGVGFYSVLGNNSTANSSVPVQVVGPGGSGVLTGVTAIAAGDYQSLALKSDGTVWAWGFGGNSGLGNNSTADSAVPVQVVGPGGVGVLTGVTAIAADYHSLALKSDGTLWSWGFNSAGQLGNNTNANSAVPVQVLSPDGTGVLTSVVAIAAAYQHSLALKFDGTVLAWGENRYGQLGNNTSTNQYPNPLPIQVLGPGAIGVFTGVTAISAGLWRSLAVKSDGTVWAWGFGADGGLGNNSLNTSLVPVQVVGPGGVGFLNLGSVGVPPGSCTAAASSTSLPEGGGAVTLTVICLTGDVPSTFSWTGGFATGLTTNPVSGNVTQTTTFTVVAGNAGGNSVPASVTVTVAESPPPAACTTQVAPWAVGTSSCSATYPGGPSGSSTTLSDIIAPDTGTVTASCTNGVLTLTTPVCVTAPPPPSLPAITLSPSSLPPFGEINVGADSLAQSVVLTNTGTANLVLGVLSLGGANPGDYLLLPSACSNATLVPFTNCVFSVSFGPLSVGIKTASVNFTSNAAGSPHSVALTGIGTTPAGNAILTVKKNGAGSGTVTSRDGGINCGSICEESVAIGSRVNLTAIAAPGSMFVGWSRAGCALVKPCAFAAAQSEVVTATFILKPQNVAGKIIYIGVCGAGALWDDSCVADRGWYDPRDVAGLLPFNPLNESDMNFVGASFSGLDVIGLRIGRLFPTSVTLVTSFSIGSVLVDLNPLIKNNVPAMVDFVTSVYYPGDKVYLVGHSAGGGIIQSVAFELRKKKIPVQMTAQIDSVGLDSTVADNVTRAFNFVHGNFAFDLCPPALVLITNIVSTSNGKNGTGGTLVTNTKIDNPVGPEESICADHRNMDNDPRVWRPVMEFMGGAFP